MPTIFQQSYHIPGLLAADVDIRCKVPLDCTLLHVSAGCGGPAAAGLELGAPGRPAAYLPQRRTGAGQKPVEFQRLDFAAGQHPRLLRGETLVARLDFDYNGGGEPAPCRDVTLVLTFAAG